ncbi:MAG: hypothetical protein AB7G28_08115 [Pirellulales bacterium]
MKHVTITFAVIALVAQTAQAGHLGFGWGGPGLGDHHGGFGHDGGFQDFAGFGFDAEHLQTRFENKFDALQSDYDTGLADIEDFYSSDDYSDVVDGMERLVDRYGLFLSGVERSIDRLGDYISIANDDLAYYDDLIADYEARDDLSEERLQRILDRLTNAQDHLTTKIDFLTEKQTTLSDSLSTYQTFSTDLSTYLDEIVTAGGGTTGGSTDESAAALLAASPLRSLSPLAALEDEASMCGMSGALDAAPTPEPATILLSILSLALLACRRPARGVPHRRI